MLPGFNRLRMWAYKHGYRSPYFHSPIAAEDTAEGGARLLARAREFVEMVLQDGLSPIPCPTIVTQKGPFSPVLVERLLGSEPEVHKSMVGRNRILETAQALILFSNRCVLVRYRTRRR